MCVRNNQIIKVHQLLLEPALAIPNYQRPYKWKQKHLDRLLADLRYHKEKSAYRLGALVFHCVQKSRPKLDIVDGQQRVLTLILIVKAILETRQTALSDLNLKEQLTQLAPNIDAYLENFTFSSVISQQNLHQNYLAAKRAVSRSDFSEEDISFLLNRCELVVFVIKELAEAFQFFDSQNARGRPLAPHDLLKAFHLREFSDHESELKKRAVSHWESLNSDTLATLFSNYLYRIRRWAHSKSARHFDTSDLEVFKGVNPNKLHNYPYAKSLLLTHEFVENYNHDQHRKIDRHTLPYPFQLDQMIINGRRFFELVDHYERLVSQVIDAEHKETPNERVTIVGVELNEKATNIINILNTYQSRTRTGDQYVRTLFDCTLIYYIDRFGGESLSEGIEKIFLWAYRCRLEKARVQLATMDEYARSNDAFEAIKSAYQPTDFLSISLPVISKTQIKGTKLDKIVKLFKESKYYD